MAKTINSLSRSQIAMPLFLGLWLFSSQITTTLQYLTQLTWQPKSLWSPWSSETALYELRYRLSKPPESHITSEAQYGSERVALIEFIRSANQYIYRFMIDVNESSTKLRVQREIIIQTQGFQNVTQSDFDNTLNNRAYTLSWRELSQEKHGFWSTGQINFSHGKTEIYPTFSPQNREQRFPKSTTQPLLKNTQSKAGIPKSTQLWCRSWLKPIHQRFGELNPDHESLTVPKTRPLTHCSKDFPLPDELWPFLVVKAGYEYNENHSQRGIQFELFNPTNGTKLGLLKRTKLKAGKQHWSRLHSLAHLKYTLINADQELQSYREHSRQQSLWLLQKTTWQDVIDRSSDTLVKSQSFKDMRTVQLAGTSLIWKRQRWVTIDLNSPIPPLDSQRQKVDLNPDGFPYKYHLLLKTQRKTEDKRDLKTQKYSIAIDVFDDHHQAQKNDPNQLKLRKVIREIITVLKNRFLDQVHHQHHSPTIHLPINIIVKEVLAWMKTEMSYQVSRGSLSLADIIEQRSGDCNELSLLFVEIMRALGIQSEMVFGLVHVQADKWSYHAWAKVKNQGQWHSVDPSRFEYDPHLAYIAFSQGTMEAQDQLAYLIGRINGKLSARSK